MTALQVAWLLGILWTRAAPHPHKVVALLVWTVAVGLACWLVSDRVARPLTSLWRVLIDHEAILLLFLAGVVIAVGVPFAYHPNRGFSDETAVAGVAQTIARDGLRSFFDRYTELPWLGRQHPPLMLLLYGLVRRTIGESLTALRMTCLAFGVGLVMVTYLLGRELYDRWTGLTAGLMLVTFPYFFRLSTVAMLDAPLAVLFNLLLVVVLLWCRRPNAARAALGGGILGVGMLTKYMMILSGPVAASWIAIHRHKRRLGPSLLAMPAVAVVIVATWLFAAHQDAILTVQATQITRLSQFATTHVRGRSLMLETLLTRLPSALGPYSVAPLLAATWLLLTRRSQSDLSLLAVVGGVAVPLLLTLPDPRYFFPAFPALAIGAAAWLRRVDQREAALVVLAALSNMVGTLYLYWGWLRQTSLFLR